MKIALFSDNLYPEISGIADSVLMLGRSLEKRGHVVAYAGPRYSPANYNKAHRSHESEQESVRAPTHRFFSLPFPGSPTGQGRIVVPYGSGIGFIRNFKADVIHAHSIFGTGIEAYIAARTLRIPLVGTNHTPLEEYMPIRTRITDTCAKRFNSFCYNRCRYMTTPSITLLKSMKASGLKTPSEVVPNPISISRFSPPISGEKTSLKKKYGLTGPVVLYAGRLAAEKHIDVIIRGIARMVTSFPDMTFAIAGHGPEEKNLRDLAEKLGISKNIKFAGFLQQDALAEIYKAADVFAMMSVVEVHSLALMNAYATGIPAVGANAGGLADHIQPDCGFLVEPGDDEALAARLATLISDAELRDKMGRAALETVKKYDADAIAQMWEKIYNSVIQAHV